MQSTVRRFMDASWRRFFGACAMLSTCVIAAWIVIVMLSVTKGFYWGTIREGAMWHVQSQRGSIRWHIGPEEAGMSRVQTVRQYFGARYVRGTEANYTFYTVITPLWMLVIPALPIPILWVWRAVGETRRKRVDDHCCADCGYDLRASVGTCPECGWKLEAL
jgi:hypothetical protein